VTAVFLPDCVVSIAGGLLVTLPKSVLRASCIVRADFSAAVMCQLLRLAVKWFVVCPPANPTSLRVSHSASVVIRLLTTSDRIRGASVLFSALQPLVRDGDWSPVARRWFSWQRIAVEVVCDVVVDGRALSETISRAFALLTSTVGTRHHSHTSLESDGKHDPSEREEKGMGVRWISCVVCSWRQSALCCELGDSIEGPACSPSHVTDDGPISMLVNMFGASPELAEFALLK
jgi:hypothetical protein